MSLTNLPNLASNHGPDGRFIKGTHWREEKPWWNREWLTNQYVTLGKSSSEIASQYGCKQNNILYWLRKHGIAKRTISESREIKHWGSSGALNPMFEKLQDANPNWKGGISPQRQSLYSRSTWKSLKKSVLERDAYTCQRCGSKPSGKRELQTHHPKRWKTYQEQRFNPDNIITICRNCHNFIHSLRNVNHEFLED